MKRTLLPCLALCGLTFCFIACTKSGNNGFSSTDHTIGMLNSRTWSGYTSGYAKGDTQRVTGDTTHYPWTKAFSRIITDTSFAVQKINGFSVSVCGTVLEYRLKETTLKYIKFDSTLSGSATTVLKYYYEADGMTFEYHRIDSFNAVSGKYYEENKYLHTN